jgi:ankyrin repeat protein
MINTIKTKSLLTDLTLILCLSCIPSKAAQVSASTATAPSSSVSSSSPLLPTTEEREKKIRIEVAVIGARERLLREKKELEERAAVRAKLSSEERKKLNAQFIKAVQSNQIEEVTKFLQSPLYNVNATNEHYTSALCLAAQGDLVSMVMLLLENGARFNVERNAIKTYNTEIASILAKKKQKLNQTLLQACKNGDELQVEVLIAKGVDITIKDSDGNTPLILAAQGGYPAVVDLLFKEANHLDIDAQNNHGDTALIVAAQAGHANVISVLLAAKKDEPIDVNIQNIDVNIQNSDGETALMKAVYEPHTKIINLLLGIRNINIDLQDKIGRTAETIAISRGHTKSVQSLLNVAFLKASENGDLQKVATLVDHGAEINAQNSYDETALILATRAGHTRIVTHLLSAKGITVDIKSWSDNSAIYWAACDGYANILRQLIQAGARVNDLTYSFPPLTWAIKYGHIDCAKILLKAKDIDVNVQKPFDDTALTMAAAKGDFEMVQLLLQAGANVNATGAWCCTALINAASGGFQDIVQLLLQIPKININSQSSTGCTALNAAINKDHTAINKDYTAIIAMLLAAGADCTIPQEKLYLCSSNTKDLLQIPPDKVLAKFQSMLRKSADQDQSFQAALGLYEMFDDHSALQAHLKIGEYLPRKTTTIFDSLERLAAPTTKVLPLARSRKNKELMATLYSSFDKHLPTKFIVPEQQQDDKEQKVHAERMYIGLIHEMMSSFKINHLESWHLDLLKRLAKRYYLSLPTKEKPEDCRIPAAPFALMPYTTRPVTLVGSTALPLTTLSAATASTQGTDTTKTLVLPITNQ